jgi:hypothetical protein
MTARSDAAVAYAAHGWFVIPIWNVRDDGSCACGDPHLTTRQNIGKHPITQCVPSGLMNATTDVEVVGRWWGSFPDANVAVVCAPSGLVVIDVDPRHGGDATLAMLEAEVELPPTMKARTGGGGWHILFATNGDSPETRYRGKLGPGLDVKYNGYVLVAPSNHVLGEYAWETRGVPPAHLPAGLQARIVVGAGSDALSGGGESGSVVDLEEIFAGVSTGNRHDAFKSLAGRLRAKRMDWVEARLLVEGAWARVEQSSAEPFPLEEALQELRWAWERAEGTTAEHELEAYKGYLDFAGLGSASREIGPAAGDQVSEAAATRAMEMLARVPDALRDGVIEALRRDEIRTLASQIRVAETFREPVSMTLAELFTSGITPPTWTVDGIHVLGSNSTLTAQYKAGKTTFLMNLMKSVVDGEPFLGEYDSQMIDGNVAFFNYELGDDVFMVWAARMGFIHPERVHILNLRGYRHDLGDLYVADWTTEWLRERDIRFWLIDPLARAYYGNENDNTELKLWTDRIDEIKLRSGCPDALVSVHTGRAEFEDGGERARGATRIDDWTDGRLVLVRSSGTDERFFSRRDVRYGDEISERRLLFNPERWRYTVDHHGGNRRVHRELDDIERLVRTLRDFGATSPETAMAKRTLKDSFAGSAGNRQTLVDRAITMGIIGEETRERNSKYCWLIEMDTPWTLSDSADVIYINPDGVQE